MYRKRNNICGLPEARINGEGKWMNAVKKYKLLVISTKNVIYNMVGKINTTICYT